MRITRLIAALPAVAIAFAAVPAAHAEPAVSCTGGAIKSLLSPGLIVEERMQTISTDGFSSTCRGSRLTRANVTLSTTGNGKCVPLGVPNAQGNGVVRWSDGTTSRFSATFRLMLTGSQATGTISEGRFTGQRLTVVGGQDDEPGEAVTDCFTGSLSYLNGDLVSITVG